MSSRRGKRSRASVFKAEARRSEGDRACFDSEGEHVIGLVYEEGFVFSRRRVVMVWRSESEYSAFVA